MRRGATLFALFGMLVIASSVQGAVTTQTAPSVAYKLANIDCRCSASAIRVRPYAVVLAILAGKKCRESKTRLGDFAVTSTHLLAKKGIRMSNLQVLRGVNRSLPASLGRTRCLDIFSAFVILAGG